MPIDLTFAMMHGFCAWYRFHDTRAGLYSDKNSRLETIKKVMG
jgi:hypothetical protein